MVTFPDCEFYDGVISVYGGVLPHVGTNGQTDTTGQAAGTRTGTRLKITLLGFWKLTIDIPQTSLEDGSRIALRNTVVCSGNRCWPSPEPKYNLMKATNHCQSPLEERYTLYKTRIHTEFWAQIRRKKQKCLSTVLWYVREFIVMYTDTWLTAN
jgi:hypothetical protein